MAYKRVRGGPRGWASAYKNSATRNGELQCFLQAMLCKAMLSSSSICFCYKDMPSQDRVSPLCIGLHYICLWRTAYYFRGSSLPLNRCAPGSQKMTDQKQKKTNTDAWPRVPPTGEMIQSLYPLLGTPVKANLEDNFGTWYSDHTSPFAKHTGQAFTVNIIIENGRVVYFLSLLVTSLSCPHTGLSQSLWRERRSKWRRQFFETQEAECYLNFCMAESLSGQGRSESCVLIGYPSWQDGPILPARDSPCCPREKRFKSFFFSVLAI